MSLVGKFQRPGSGRQGHWRLLGPFDVDPQLPAGVIFLFKLALVRRLGPDQIAGQAHEIGVDALFAADRFDPA